MTSSLNILLPTVGSSGDVHPVVALALALKARGHRTTVITSPVFQGLIEGEGLGFLPLGTVEHARETIADPNLWHPRKGFEVVARRVIVPAIREVYDHIQRHADATTVVVGSGLALGARVAHERLGIPLATVHLQPSMIRSLVDMGIAGHIRISATQLMWMKRAFFRLVDWLVIDRALKGPLNDLRATLGLAPIDRVMHRWVHSPQLVIAFFPEWFAAAQPDWPANTHLVGFPLWDGGRSAPLTADAEAFLGDGPPPVVFTPGSAAATLHGYFRESVGAVRELGIRAMLVTNFPEQLPADLPAHVKAFGYQPFSTLLPRASLFVHHGGIGTLAQAIRAGIPQLLVPNGHDQFDNAWRIERLGLGRRIPQTSYRAPLVARTLRDILDDEAGRARCVEAAPRIDPAAAVRAACELIEKLASEREVATSAPRMVRRL
jgi:rhamnosyltransferase subunit B